MPHIHSLCAAPASAQQPDLGCSCKPPACRLLLGLQWKQKKNTILGLMGKLVEEKVKNCFANQCANLWKSPVLSWTCGNLQEMLVLLKTPAPGHPLAQQCLLLHPEPQNVKTWGLGHPHLIQRCLAWERFYCSRVHKRTWRRGMWQAQNQTASWPKHFPGARCQQPPAPPAAGKVCSRAKCMGRICGMQLGLPAASGCQIWARPKCFHSWQRCSTSWPWCDSRFFQYLITGDKMLQSWHLFPQQVLLLAPSIFPPTHWPWPKFSIVWHSEAVITT